MNGIYETKANYVFDYLKEKILNGELKQGENVVISRIAEELDMSTIPVREALKRLESEGLVEFNPHKGAQVTTFDKKKIREILEIRAVLESYAARDTCGKIDETNLNKLFEMNEKMKTFAERKQDESFSNMNKEFHRLLYAVSENRMLFDLIFNLWDGGNWSKSIFAYYPEKMLESVKEHDDILNAIKSNLPDSAEKLTRNHKMKNIKYYLDLSSE